MSNIKIHVLHTGAVCVAPDLPPASAAQSDREKRKCAIFQAKTNALMGNSATFSAQAGFLFAVQSSALHDNEWERKPGMRSIASPKRPRPSL